MLKEILLNRHQSNCLKSIEYRKRMLWRFLVEVLCVVEMFWHKQ